ncbi:hypothetical protein [Bacillus infantis]|uniref:hypothetical protein n=1 Tax=Bacillus infantis TaxID=324767 RepID=UPI003CEEFFC4
MGLIKFVEHTTGIKLNWYQKAYLMALHQGQMIFSPRQQSKKLFLNKIEEFTKNYSK